MIMNNHTIIIFTFLKNPLRFFNLRKKLSLFLKDSIDRKRLKKVKEVIYDKEKGKIIDIPGLQFNKSSKNFTLRNLDKRPSTVKSLPKKFNHTIKNKLTQDQSENGENDI